jgi:hypothetical protein
MAWSIYVDIVVWVVGLTSVFFVPIGRPLCEASRLLGIPDNPGPTRSIRINAPTGRASVTALSQFGELRRLLST